MNSGSLQLKPSVWNTSNNVKVHLWALKCEAEEKLFMLQRRQQLLLQIWRATKHKHTHTKQQHWDTEHTGTSGSLRQTAVCSLTDQQRSIINKQRRTNPSDVTCCVISQTHTWKDSTSPERFMKFYLKLRVKTCCSLCWSISWSGK